MSVSALAGSSSSANIGTPMLGVDSAGNFAFLRGGADAVATNETATSGAGADVSMTWDAETNVAHVLRDLVWSYSAAPTGGEVLVLDGTDTVVDFHVTAAGPGSVSFGSGKQGHAGRLMTVTLKGGGGAIVGKINASHLVVSSIAGGALDFGDEMNSGLLMLLF